MRRRKFITLLGAALALPGAALAQDAARTRKLGILVNLDSDEEGKARINAFTQALNKCGWTEGANLQTAIRWAGDNAERYREFAKELISLKPDALPSGTMRLVVKVNDSVVCA